MSELRKPSTFTMGNMLCAIAVTALLFSVAAGNAAAQVLVSPTVVFISDKNPTGRLTLLNQSPHDQEITVEFSFGLPVSDSLGNVFVTFQDSAVTDPRSALDWVKAFPRSVIIKPDERQILRLMARPPKELPDGEYWARVMISSRRTQTPVMPLDKEGTIGTKIYMVTRQAIMLKYRKGDLTCKLDLLGASAQIKDSTVEVIVDMANRGNVSYMGTLQCWLRDSKGTEIDHHSLRLAVYRDLKRCVKLNLGSREYKPPYEVQVKISSEGRNDINPKDLITGNKISYSVIVE